MSTLYQCPGCGNEKPRTKEYFDRSYQSYGDGLRLRCKSCRTERVIIRNRKKGIKPAIVARVNGNKKECVRCKVWLPNTEEYFQKDYRTSPARQELKGACTKCIVRDANISRAKPHNRATILCWHYKRHDRVKGRKNNLTPEYTLSIITQPCSYCGSADNVGCDRIDNSLGHVVGNVTPCCSECNMVRGNKFTPLQMRLYVGPAIRAAREETKHHVVIATADIPEAELKEWKHSPRIKALLEFILPEIPKGLHFLTMLGTEAAIFSY